MLNIIQRRKIWFIFSGLLIIGSIFSLSLWGLRLSIDFTGGSLLEIEFKNGRPDLSELTKTIEPLQLEHAPIQPTGKQDIILRTKLLDDETRQNLLKTLKDKYGEIEEKRFESIGPIIGKELARKTIYALMVALVCMILYVAWAFRKVSKDISSWKFGVCALLALVHDVLITCGFFSILGHFLHIEVGVLFIVALLIILGYSINDTIVIFDRIRENLIYAKEESFEATVNKSVNQCLARSINTSSTTLFVILAIYLFGGAVIQNFVLALMLGVGFGTYSSIFIASPLLVAWQRREKRA